MASIIPKNPSAEFIRLNPQIYATSKGALELVESAVIHRFSLRITGQIRGGKNAMGITRTGRHYAKAPFKLWRDAAVSELRRQLPAHWKPVAMPVSVRLDYVAGDKRRRDMPAIVDAIWHALEKAGVVEDDALLWILQSTRGYSKESPGCTITFL